MKPFFAALAAALLLAGAAHAQPMPEPVGAPPAGTYKLDRAHASLNFRSTKVEVTGPKTAKVTGDFTMRGVTKPVTLDVTYNGGYGKQAYDPGGSRIGFSAHGWLKRSDYGISMGIPAPGSVLGVGDDVEIIIEAEFNRPLDKTGP